VRKFREFFDLTAPYQFDINDIIATIYVGCAVLGIAGGNPTIPFFIGSAISICFCWQARRINLVVLNAALFALNAVSLARLIF
jgi:hypothetical protein